MNNQISPSLSHQLLTEGWWSFYHIFSFLAPLSSYSPLDLIDLRSSCQLFHQVLPRPSRCCWTTFPNPKHATLTSLLSSINDAWSAADAAAAAAAAAAANVATTAVVTSAANATELAQEVRRSVGDDDDDDDDDNDDKLNPRLRLPTVIYLGRGTFDCGTSLVITCPISLVGVGRDDTILDGGIEILGKNKKNKIVILKNLTVSNAKMHGIHGNDGMMIATDQVSVERCGYYGIWSFNSIVVCHDLVVRDCGWSGVRANISGIVEISGIHT